MRLVDIRERTVPISRYRDPTLATGGLTTSLLAIVTDVERGGRPVIGYGFSSFGRYGQGGLIGERFAPRLLSANPGDLLNQDGTNLDPPRAWQVMMAGEKPGGHGERCVAVGTLDMALWDAAAKIAGQPLYRFAAARLGRPNPADPTVPLYASGGYPYPADDLVKLEAELTDLKRAGYTAFKIKLGNGPLEAELRRVEIARRILGPDTRLAVDAMNRFGPTDALEAVRAMGPFDLWWLEDLCDPHDFATLAESAGVTPCPLCAGEALFSLAEAKLLHAHGGLDPARDILLFDPVHCYGLTHYADIVAELERLGWPRSAFWPHGGHLFSLQAAAALGLGGSEVNPLSFQPFGGLPDESRLEDRAIRLGETPGIGLETRAGLRAALMDALA